MVLYNRFMQHHLDLSLIQSIDRFITTKPFVLRAGDTLQVFLTNPLQEGYEWVLEKMPDFVSSKEAETLGTLFQQTLYCKKDGQGTLVFKNRLPWDQNMHASFVKIPLQVLPGQSEF